MGTVGMVILMKTNVFLWSIVENTTKTVPNNPQVDGVQHQPILNNMMIALQEHINPIDIALKRIGKLLKKNMFVRLAQLLWMATPVDPSCIMGSWWMAVLDRLHGAPPVWTAATTM